MKFLKKSLSSALDINGDKKRAEQEGLAREEAERKEKEAIEQQKAAVAEYKRKLSCGEIPADELPPVERMRRDLIKFYHHPNNILFGAGETAFAIAKESNGTPLFALNHNNNNNNNNINAKPSSPRQPIQQQFADTLLTASETVPVYLREIFQADIEKIMIEIPPKPIEPECDEKGNKIYRPPMSAEEAASQLPPSYDPYLLADKKPERTDSALRQWCNDLFFAPLMEIKSTFVTADSLTKSAAGVKSGAGVSSSNNNNNNEPNIPPPKKKKRFEAFVEGIPGSGKTELAKRICQEQPFDNAIAIYLPLHRLNYAPNEVNEFEELLQLALGVTFHEGKDPDLEYEAEQERLKKEQEDEIRRKKIENGEIEEVEEEHEADDHHHPESSTNKKEAFKWPGEDTDSGHKFGDDDDGGGENVDTNDDAGGAAEGPITGALGAEFEKEVYLRYKFDKDTISMITNMIDEIQDLGEDEDSEDDDPDFQIGNGGVSLGAAAYQATSTFYPSSPTSPASSRNKKKKKKGGKRSNSGKGSRSNSLANSFASASGVGMYPDGRFAEDPIRIIWIVDDLDAVDCGPERTQNFIRDFVSPAGRHGESLSVLRKLYSTPNRNCDSILCFTREIRNRDACVLSDINFPCRRFVMERWNHEQTESAFLRQLYAKMTAVFDEKAVTRKKLREFSKDRIFNHDTFFGHHGAFQGSPYLVDVFAEVLAQIARRSQSEERFDKMRCSLPPPEVLKEYMQKFSSPVALFDQFISFRAEKSVPFFQRQLHNLMNSKYHNSNDNNTGDAAAPSKANLLLLGPTPHNSPVPKNQQQPHHLAFFFAGKLANQLLKRLHFNKDETLLSFSFHGHPTPTTSMTEGQEKNKKKKNNIEADYFLIPQVDPLENNWWADALYECGLLYRIDRPNYSKQHADAVEKNTKNKAAQIHQTMLMANDIPYTYQFRSRMEMEFFAIFWIVNPHHTNPKSILLSPSGISPSALTKIEKEAEQEFHRKIIEELPFENNHRVVWIAIAAHFILTEKIDGKLFGSSGTKSQFIMQNVAERFFKSYNTYRATLAKAAVHALDDIAVPVHQDTLCSSLLVELTKSFPPQMLFDGLEKQHGVHWTLPSHFYWMFPQTGQFGLLDTFNDILRRIRASRDKERNEPAICLWRLLLQSLLVAPISGDDAQVKIIQAIRSATVKTHLMLQELPKVRVFVHFDHNKNPDNKDPNNPKEPVFVDPNDFEYYKYRRRVVRHMMKSYRKQMGLPPVAGDSDDDGDDDDPDSPTNRGDPDLIAPTGAFDLEREKAEIRNADVVFADAKISNQIQAKVLTQDDRTNQTLLAGAKAVVAGRAVTAAIADHEEQERQAELKRLEEIEAAKRKEEAENAPPVPPLLPQVQITSEVPPTTDGWDALFKKANEMATAEIIPKAPPASNNGAKTVVAPAAQPAGKKGKQPHVSPPPVSPTTPVPAAIPPSRSAKKQLPDKWLHLAEVSLRKCSPEIFKKLQGLLAIEEMTRKKVEQVCLGTASTQFQVSKFYFKNWVVDSNYSRDLWDVGAERRSGGNDAWFATFAPIRRVVDGDGIKQVLELSKFTQIIASRTVDLSSNNSNNGNDDAHQNQQQNSSAPPAANATVEPHKKTSMFSFMSTGNKAPPPQTTAVSAPAPASFHLPPPESSVKFSEKLEKLETGVCRADTADRIFGRDPETGKLRCRLALVEGPPHVGKSTWAQQLCVMQPFFGRVAVYIPFATLLVRHPTLIDSIETFVKTMQTILASLPFSVDFNVPFVWVLDEMDCIDRGYDKKLASLLKNFSDSATSSTLMTQRSFTPSLNGEEFLKNGGMAATTPRSGGGGAAQHHEDPNNNSNNNNNDAQKKQLSTSGRPHDLCLVISREIRENGGCFLDPAATGADSAEFPLERWYLGPWSPLLVKQLAYEIWRRLCSARALPLADFYQTVQQVCSLPAMVAMCQRPKLLAMVCRLTAVGRISGKTAQQQEFLSKLTPVAVFMMDLAERAQGRVKFGAFKNLIANIAPIAVRSVAAGFPFRLSAVETFDVAVLTTRSGGGSGTNNNTQASATQRAGPAATPSYGLASNQNARLLNNNNNNNLSNNYGTSAVSATAVTTQRHNIAAPTPANRNTNNNANSRAPKSYMDQLNDEMESPDWLANLVILGLVRSEFVQGKKPVGTQFGTPFLYTNKNFTGNTPRQGDLLAMGPLPSTPVADYLEQESGKNISIIFSRRHDVEYLAAVGLLEHSSALQAMNDENNNNSKNVENQKKQQKQLQNNNNSRSTVSKQLDMQQQEQAPVSIPPFCLSLRQAWFLCALSANDKSVFMQLASAAATPVLSSFSMKFPLAAIFASIMVVEMSSITPRSFLDLLETTNNLHGSEALFMMSGVLGSANAIEYFLTNDRKVVAADPKRKKPPISFAAVYQCFVRACLHGDCCYNDAVFDKLHHFSRGTTNIHLNAAAKLGSVGCLTWLMETFHEKKPEQIRASFMKERFKEWEQRMEAKKQIMLEQQRQEQAALLVNEKNGKKEKNNNSLNECPPASADGVLPPSPPLSDAEKQSIKEKQLAAQTHKVQLFLARKTLKDNRDADGYLLLADEVWIPQKQEQ